MIRSTPEVMMPMFLALLLSLLLMAAPAHAGPRVGVSASGTVASIGTSYATGKALACGSTTTVESRAQAIPGGARIGWVHLQLSSISGATTVTWKLTMDSDLDVAISTERTSTIVTGVTTATDGAVVQSFERMPIVPTNTGTIYVAAKADSGTFSAVCRVFWEQL